MHLEGLLAMLLAVSIHHHRREIPRNPGEQLSSNSKFLPLKMGWRCGCFLKWWYPTIMRFPIKNDHFGVFWGYHHLRKHPCDVTGSISFKKHVYVCLTGFWRCILFWWKIIINLVSFVDVVFLVELEESHDETKWLLIWSHLSMNSQGEFGGKTTSTKERPDIFHSIHVWYGYLQLLVASFSALWKQAATARKTPCFEKDFLCKRVGRFEPKQKPSLTWDHLPKRKQ